MSDSTGDSPGSAVGGAEWVSEVLARHWGPDLGTTTPTPLGVRGGERPLSHTAGLWEIRRHGTPYLFKVQLDRQAARAPRFYPLKQQVLDHCAGFGVPVASAVPALDGTPAVWADGHVCEVIPLVAGAAAVEPTSAQAEAVIRAGLTVRHALDAVPGALTDELAPVALPELVAEPHWRRALADAEQRLLPLALRRSDRWGRVAANALEALVTARPVLEAAADEPTPPARRAVVHGDLHYHHFLLDEQRRPEVVAVLDFDNLHVGDRLLDLAWVADTAGRVGGGRVAVERTLYSFIARAGASGLLTQADTRLLMPLLMRQAVPVIVDIAKDILERDILSPHWPAYFALLDPTRRVRLHRLLTTAPVDVPPLNDTVLAGNR
ncbi:phosphotransferase enzyme family protein [Streptomyces spinosus]|uniref:phosphotransferase enzyme family protein n=1 Tax=Streptomyces spinosus TaxID=2872623 RepID=UPI001CECDBA3|nr:phosphotransferase [Streptomyces spinosus]